MYMSTQIQVQYHLFQTEMGAIQTIYRGVFLNSLTVLLHIKSTIFESIMRKMKCYSTHSYFGHKFPYNFMCILQTRSLGTNFNNCDIFVLPLCSSSISTAITISSSIYRIIKICKFPRLEYAKRSFYFSGVKN